ncbi:MAG TPA: sugar ABC transporter permease [Clostridiaceae bacterium]|nr:sugar ABC transporter permease [Clostridiaceae bacterium]
MYGIQIAFKDFIATKGIIGSPWVGFKHFNRFFNSYYFTNILTNTLRISIYSMVVAFPVPIILALLLNEVKNQHYKKFIQTVTYAPHFISMVVMASMIISFLSPSMGIVNHLIKAMGFEPIPFMEKANLFPTIYVFSGIWQNAGWNSVMYFAALSTIDPQLYEAGRVDGCTTVQKIWYIDLPGIIPMIVILLILNCGNILSVGFEKVYLLQNNLNIETSEVISTYVYKVGLQKAEYSFSTAVGLFNSVVNFILLVTVNSIAKKLGQSSLW